MKSRLIAALAVIPLLFGGAMSAQADTKVPPKSSATHFQPIKHPVSGVASKLPPEYHYQQGFKDMTGGGAVNTGANTVTATVSQHTRPLAATDYHTLFEAAGITPASGAGMRNIVEIGNNTDIAVNGDTVTRLFGGIWVNGSFLGYPTANSNNAGFVDNPAEAVSFHTALAVTASGAAPSVFYEYKIGRGNTTICDPAHLVAKLGWLVYQQNVASTRIVACAPDTNWTSAGETFTKIDEFQAFNEVVSFGGTAPCSNAGSGVFGTSTLPSAAEDVKSFAFSGAVAGTTVDWDAVQVNPAADSPTYYRAFDGAGYSPSDPKRLRLGGPGDASC